METYPLTTHRNGEFSVSVMGPVVGIICDACSMDGGRTWNVCRLFLATGYRRQGLGTRMLSELRTYLLTQPGAEEVNVAPGGYDTPRRVQRAFYRSCGFKAVRGTPGLMAYSLRAPQA